MRIWDLKNSKAFQEADGNEPIWYADGCLGYVRLSPFGEVNEGRVVFSKSDGSYILSPADFGFIDDSLEIFVNPNVKYGVALNTQGCVVVKEKYGIVIKERDMV